MHWDTIIYGVPLKCLENQKTPRRELFYYLRRPHLATVAL